jgi:hypothetical protein
MATTYELLVIEGSGIDRVLIVRRSDRDEQEYIDEAIEFGSLDNNAEIVERIPLTESQANAMDTMRPYVG